MLPKVNRELAFGLEREIDRPDWHDQMVERLEGENPVIAEFLARYVEDDCVFNSVGVLTVGLMVYRMLEAQMECNELAETANLE